MTEQKVGSFLAELAAAQRAMERVPELEAILDRQNRVIDDYAKQVQALELRAIDRKSEIDGLHAKLREAEVSRDDAELRFLEADEQLVKIAKSFQVALEAMDHTDKVIEKANDTLHPAPAEAVRVEQISPGAEPGPSTASGVPASWVGDHITPPTGQSESSPTMDAPVVDGSAGSAHVDAAVPNAATTQSEPQAGPYSGKLYINVPGWIERSDWLAGGGTHETYDWRSGPLPEGIAA